MVMVLLSYHIMNKFLLLIQIILKLRSNIFHVRRSVEFQHHKLINLAGLILLIMKPSKKKLEYMVLPIPIQ